MVEKFRKKISKLLGTWVKHGEVFVLKFQKKQILSHPTAWGHRFLPATSIIVDVVGSFLVDVAGV